MIGDEDQELGVKQAQSLLKEQQSFQHGRGLGRLRSGGTRDSARLSLP